MCTSVLLLLVGWWCVFVVVFGGRGVYNSHFPLNLWFFSFACAVKPKLTKWRAKKAAMNVEALLFCVFSMLASTSSWSVCSETFIHHYHIPLADKEHEACDSHCPGDQPG